MNAPRPRALLLLAPLALGLLYWLGRPAAPSVAAAPLVLDAASEAQAVEAALSGDGSDLDAATDTATDAPDALALQLLPDGGLVVDLNLATEQDLRRIAGIGPGRAKAILALRAKLGRFKTVDDLLRIKGFGKATLRRLRPQLRV